MIQGRTIYAEFPRFFLQNIAPLQHFVHIFQNFLHCKLFYVKLIYLTVNNRVITTQNKSSQGKYGVQINQVTVFSRSKFSRSHFTSFVTGRRAIKLDCIFFIIFSPNHKLIFLTYRIVYLVISKINLKTYLFKKSYFY